MVVPEQLQSFAGIETPAKVRPFGRVSVIVTGYALPPEVTAATLVLLTFSVICPVLLWMKLAGLCVSVTVNVGTWGVRFRHQPLRPLPALASVLVWS